MKRISVLTVGCFIFAFGCATAPAPIESETQSMAGIPETQSPPRQEADVSSPPSGEATMDLSVLPKVTRGVEPIGPAQTKMLEIPLAIDIEPRSTALPTPDAPETIVIISVPTPDAPIESRTIDVPGTPLRTPHPTSSDVGANLPGKEGEVVVVTPMP